MTTITLDLCKTPDVIMNEKSDFIGSGSFWLKRSKTNNKKHAFYYRDSKSRKVLRDEAGDVIRPQHVAKGIYTVKQLRERAEALAKGETPSPLCEAKPEKIEGETLAAVLDRFLKHSKACDDIRREITLFAHDWLNQPAAAITKEAVAARVRQIASGTYPHPFFGMDAEQQKIACREIGIGVPRKKTTGTPKLAEKFGRYLRAVLVSGAPDERVFESGDDPVTEADPISIVKSAEGDDCLDVKRPALPLRSDELAAVFNYSRSQCKETKNGQSDILDVLVWRSVLCTRLALLSGYRVGDIATLHDGNDQGDILKKKKGECVKRPTATHALPVSSQMRAIIDEAVAMRDGDADTLKKSFGWTKAELFALDAARGKKLEGSKLLFPNFTNGAKQSQPSQLLRPAFNRFKAKGKFKKQDRRTGPNEWLGEDTHPKPHDCRATFATYAYGTGLDMLTVANYMNHKIPAAMEVMTARYIGGSKTTDSKHAAGFQTISDTILNVARDEQKSRLSIIDGGVAS